MRRNAGFYRVLGLLSALFTFGALLTGCSSNSDDAQTLTIYSGRSEEYIAPFLAEFTAETGIKLEIRYADSAALAAQLLDEGENADGIKCVFVQLTFITITETITLTRPT